ncbi:MAG: diacylglycerol kinase family lipid kinase [Longimicrobiales bacterium]|nr:diacylglycerol kinase family lipid kinase [Longimicrobiales bacterium]
MKRPEKITVILNPAASGGGGGRLQPKVEAGLAKRKIPFALFRSEGPGHAEALAREAALDGAELILVVGGDGTIHEVANGLLKGETKPPPIAVVPVGTGNDFYRMVSGSRSIGDALDALLDGEVRDFDVGRVRFLGTASYFVNLLGVGVDVEVLGKRSDFPRLGGLPQYLAALVSALMTFRPVSLRISLRGHDEEGGEEIIDDRTILMAVTVGPSVGGGFLLNPDASPYDGLLDLFFVRTLGMLRLARYIPKVIRGTHQGVPELLQRRVTAATVRRSDETPFFFEMDGERMPDPVTRLEIGVCPGILPVLVPGGGR